MLKQVVLRSVATETFSDGSWVLRIPRQLGYSYLGEQLSPLKREPGNRKDPFTVAVERLSVTVGHVPISSVCSMFLLRGGTIDNFSVSGGMLIEC